MEEIAEALGLYLSAVSRYIKETGLETSGIKAKQSLAQAAHR